MTGYATAEVTALSSKGQIVLPSSLRKKMNLEEGCKFVVFSDGENILLKPIMNPDIKEFDSLTKKARTWAKEAGLTKADINDAIKKVRAKKWEL